MTKTKRPSKHPTPRALFMFRTRSFSSTFLFLFLRHHLLFFLLTMITFSSSLTVLPRRRKNSSFSCVSHSSPFGTKMILNRQLLLLSSSLSLSSSSSALASSPTASTEQTQKRKKRKHKSKTPSTTKSSSTKSKPSPPTARSVAVSALASAASKESNNNNNDRFYYFATRYLESNPDYFNHNVLKDQRDRSYARLLVATVERYMGQIDKVLSLLCKDVYPPTGGHTKHAYLLRATLQVGAAQILFLNTPNHAAIKETVDVLKMKLRKKNGGVTKPLPEAKIKFVNAILRSITRQGLQILETQTSSLDNISPWLIDEWSTSWGGLTVATNIANTMMRDYNGVDISSKVYLSSLSEEEDDDDDDEKEDDYKKKKKKMENMIDFCNEFGKNAIILPHGSIRITTTKSGSNDNDNEDSNDDRTTTTTTTTSGAVSNWPRYNEGIWWVQDASAALPALALRNAFIKNRNKNLSLLHVVDMCAAPGGKTSQLLSMGFGRVTAVETSARRSRRLIENLNRLEFDVADSSSSKEEDDDDDEEKRLEEKQHKPLYDIVISDGRDWLPSSLSNHEEEEEEGEASASVVNGILLDVPCSATGTGARNPDVLRKDPNLGNLLQIQEELANHCVDDVLPIGGVLVYATCSLLEKEGEGQIAKLLARRENNDDDDDDDEKSIATMKTVPFEKGEIPGFDGAIDKNGWLRVLPGALEGELANCDGFFVARLVKVA